MSKKALGKQIFDVKAVFEPDDYLYFYKDAFTDKRAKRELDFLVNELKLDKTMQILDLACGHGRHANRLAEFGYNVTGVDITKGFIEIAKKDAKSRGVNVKYIRQDMRKITFREEFDRIIILFTAFGYFKDKENYKVLENVEKALKPKGLFCFDIPDRDGFVKEFLPYVVVEKNKDLMIDRNTFDRATKRIYDKRIIIRNGKRKDAPFFIRLYNSDEIRKLLNKAGFGIYKIYENWHAKPFTRRSKTGMIIIAQKIK
jgi:SAM-dependent methyltransferase